MIYKKLSLPISLNFFILIIFIILSWIVSEPMRAAKIDRYILYYVDEVIRYFHAKASLYNPLVFLNPYAKPIPMIFSNIFLRILPFGMASLRLMNSLFSAGTIFLLSLIMRKLGFKDIQITIAILITATFPAYFLASFSTLSEPLFSFCLLLSIYLFFLKMNFWSCLSTSLLPVIRQEGVLYICLWLFLLWQKKERKYIPLLFIPLLVWIVINKIILGHSLSYVLLFLPKISGGIPPDSLIQLNQLSIGLLVWWIPLIFIFLWGFIDSLNKPQYKIIMYCTSIGIGLMVIINILLYLFMKHICYELRFLIASIPLMSIYIVNGLGVISMNSLKNKIIYLLSGLLLFINIYGLRQLQNLPYSRKNILTMEEEADLKSITIWLNENLQKENIKDIYYMWMTDNIMRRILIELPAESRYYIIVDDKTLFDVITFQRVPLLKNRAILILPDGINIKGLSDKVNYRLEKGFSDIRMNVCLIEPKQL